MRATDEHMGPVRRILFCTDFSVNAELAFNWAIDAVRRRPGATLYLLHVIPEPQAQFWKTYIYEIDDVDNKARHDIDQKVDEVYRPRVPAGVRLEVEIRVGKETHAILDFAREHNVDLIVIGRQGHGALDKVLFGNVTEQICRKAECAVLVVPLSVKNRTPDRGEPGGSEDGSQEA